MGKDLAELGFDQYNYRCGNLVFFFNNKFVLWEIPARKPLVKCLPRCLKVALFRLYSSFSSHLKLMFLFFRTNGPRFVWSVKSNGLLSLRIAFLFISLYGLDYAFC